MRHILPQADAESNIGSDDLRFANIYAENGIFSTINVVDSVIMPPPDFAQSAANDDEGNNIADTYATKEVLNASVLELADNLDDIEAAYTSADTTLQGNINTLSSTVTNNYNTLDAKFDDYLPKTGGTISSNLTVSGNLTVKGTSTIVDTEELAVTDNLIVINNGESGEGVTSGLAGLKVDRGTEDAYYIQFDEVDDMFKVGMAGDLEIIASHDWCDNKFLTQTAAASTYVTQTAFNSTLGDIEDAVDAIIGGA